MPPPLFLISVSLSHYMILISFLPRRGSLFLRHVVRIDADLPSYRGGGGGGAHI